MKNPKFTIYQSLINSQYYYRLLSTNGEIILSGEGYISKQSCLAGIQSVKINSPYDIRYDRIGYGLNYTFNLKAGNGEIIGRSENYTSASGRDNGISAVKRVAPTAPVEDLTAVISR